MVNTVSWISWTLRQHNGSEVSHVDGVACKQKCAIWWGRLERWLPGWLCGKSTWHGSLKAKDDSLNPNKGGWMRTNSTKPTLNLQVCSWHANTIIIGYNLKRAHWNKIYSRYKFKGGNQWKVLSSPKPEFFSPLQNPNSALHIDVFQNISNIYMKRKLTSFFLPCSSFSAHETALAHHLYNNPVRPGPSILTALLPNPSQGS